MCQITDFVLTITSKNLGEFKFKKMPSMQHVEDSGRILNRVHLKRSLQIKLKATDARRKKDL